MKVNRFPLLIVLLSSVVLTSCLPKQNQELVQTQDQEQEEEGAVNQSLKDLMGSGKNLECSWEFEDPEGKGRTTGLVYIAGNRSRSEVRVRVEGEGEELANMDLISINDGQMGYMWNEGQTTGSKYNIAEMEKLGEEMSQGQENITQNQTQNDWENIYNYQCKNRRVDESKFSVPTNVEFTDMMAQMQQMQEQTENMKGVCDDLPEPQKSQCLEAME